VPADASMAPTSAYQPMNIVEMISENPELSTLVDLLSDPAQEDLLFALMGMFFSRVVMLFYNLEFVSHNCDC
jgi:hypothetical protein